MSVCVKGALHQKGSNDMIRRDPSHPVHPPRPPSTRKIQICTNPKFPTTQKYIIKSKVEEENNSPFVVVVVDSSFFCLFVLLFFFQWSFFNTLTHTHTHILFVTYSKDTVFVCLLFGNTCSREKMCGWGGGGQGTRNALVQGWHSGYEGMMPTKVIPTFKKKKVQIKSFEHLCADNKNKTPNLILQRKAT